MLINFEIPGPPVAKGRAKAFRRGDHIGHYTPEKTTNYETLVKLAANQAMAGREIFDCPVCLRAELFVPIPASWSEKKKRQALNHEIMPAKKPDCSNYLKIVEDGMNGIVYRDDSQIIQATVRKLYSDRPRAEVTVQEFVWGGF